MALLLQDGTALQLQDGTDLELQGGTSLAITNPNNWVGYSAQEATFSVTASGGTDPYTYQWYETTAGLLVGETSSTLDFIAATPDSGNSYYCIVTDFVSDTAQSSAATITVTDMPVEVTEDVFVRNEDDEWVSIKGNPGEDGDAADVIDDSVTATDKTWSSSRLTNELNQKLNVSDYDQYKNRWLGTWVSGSSHSRYDQVIDDGWLMIANKTTEDRPSPQPIGETFSLYDGTMSETPQSAKQIIFGNRFTLSGDGYIQGYRVYTITGNHYSLYIIKDPTGTPVLDTLVSFTADTDGWQSFAIDPVFVSSAGLVDLVSVVNEPDPTPTTWSANYDYTTPQNAAAPAAGQIVHSRGQSDIFDIHYTDNDTTDRTAAIQALAVGDIIDGAGQRWVIQSVSDQTTYMRFGVNPALVGSPTGVQSFDFETVTATPITYAFDTDYWLTAPYTAQGLLGVDTDYGSITPNNTAYGTDIFVQLAIVSEDWDFQAYSGGASSGAASLGITGPVLAAVNGILTTYDARLTALETNPMDIQFADSPSIDAFSRARVSEPVTVFDSKQIYDNQPLFWDDAEVTGGSTTSTYSQNEAATTLAVAATTAGRRVRQTFQSHNYQAGKSQLILLTGVMDDSGGGTGITRGIGLYDDKNGIFFKDDEGTLKIVRRTYVSGSAVDTEVAQASWNKDTMDGNGDSGVTIDLSKTNIFLIDFEWLGVGRVRCGFVIDGLIVYCHEFLNANNLTDVYMSSPNLPIRYEIENDGTGAASEIKHICCSVMSEGGVQNNGMLRYNSTSGTHIDANTADTVYAICALRLKAASNGVTVKVEGVSLLAETADDFEWFLVANPTVANAVTFSDQTNSACQFAVGNAGSPSNSTVTGGTILDGGFVQGGRSINEVPSSTYALGKAIDGTVDEVYLCARPLTSNLDVQGSITWREFS